MFLTLLMLVGSVIPLSACGDSPGITAAPPQQLQVRFDVPSLMVQTSTRATAIAIDSTGAAANLGLVEWRTANPAIATVEQDGTVRGVAPGITQVVATAEGLSGSADIVVSKPSRFDTFASYASAAALLANTGSNAPYCGFVQSSGIAVDANVRYNGHQTVRVTQAGGSSDIPRLTSCFTSRNFWFRVKLRFAPGWTTTGSNSGTANSFKMFGWWWQEGDGRGDLEITNTTQYLLQYNAAYAGSPFAVVGAGNVSNEWTDGAWYDYIIHYQVTSSGARTRFWLARDGQAPVLRATTTGSASPTAAGIGFPFYFNQTVRTTQSLWIGQWEVVDGQQYPNPFAID